MMKRKEIAFNFLSSIRKQIQEQMDLLYAVGGTLTLQSCRCVSII
jgi:hypothetical protein